MNEKTFIINSGKCSWGACFACGWGKIEGPKMNIHQLKDKIDEILSQSKGFDRIKIFCSGSFLDDAQFPRTIRKYLASKFKTTEAKELVIESRPEYVTEENLSDFQGIKLLVAIGLEVANNDILKKYNKGFTIEDYIKASENLHKNGFRLRTYLMVGLPFIENLESELKKSVEFARKYSDEIVLINVFPHSKAPIYDLWISGKWKPLDKEQFENLTKPYDDCEKEFDNFAFVPRFSNDKKEFIKGATAKQLLHPHFEVWQDYFSRFYNIPEGKEIALFIPCAFRKPYPKSKLHKSILAILKGMKEFSKIHIIVISTPGVIPYEFANNYPFNAYDWPEWDETPEIKKLYTEVTEKRIENYLKNHKYKKYFCYFKYSAESYAALQQACEKSKIKCPNLLEKETYEKIKDIKNPLSTEEALNDLKKNIK